MACLYFITEGIPVTNLEIKNREILLHCALFVDSAGTPVGQLDIHANRGKNFYLLCGSSQYIHFNEFPQRHKSDRLPLPALNRQMDYLAVLSPIYWNKTQEYTTLHEVSFT